jgi:hypothetical protein
LKFHRFNAVSDNQHLRSGIPSELQELAENARDIRLGLHSLRIRRRRHAIRVIAPLTAAASPGLSSSLCGWLLSLRLRQRVVVLLRACSVSHCERPDRIVEGVAFSDVSPNRCFRWWDVSLMGSESAGQGLAMPVNRTPEPTHLDLGYGDRVILDEVECTGNGGAMGKLLRALMIGLLLTAGGGNASADPLEDGIAAYQRGDFATALRLFQPLAEQGNASAQSNLGVMYEQGRGVAQNYREAMRWFRLAAMQGDASAQSNLGVMYFKGQGIAQDFREAMKWYRLGAGQGNAEAQFNLGIMYEQGRGVPQDLLRAHMWFNLAVSQSSEESGKLAIKSRDIVRQRLTRAQLFQAQEMARQCEANGFKNCD